VPVLDRTEYEDILVLREGLESTAYRLIKDRGTTPDAKVEKALHRILEVTEDVPWPDRLELDCALHQALVDLAGSRRLSQSFEALMVEFRLCRLQSLEWLEQLTLERWKEMHVDLVEAIKHPDESVDLGTHFLATPWNQPHEGPEI
jgi:DNA-binding GntR family transcriptional regulator